MLKRLSISQRIAIVYATLLIVIGVQLVFSLGLFGMIKGNAQRSLSSITPKLVLDGEFIQHANRLSGDIYSLLVADTPQDAQQLAQAYAEDKRRMTEILEEAAKLSAADTMTEEREYQIYEQLRSQLERTTAVLDQVLAQALAGDNAGALQTLRSQGEPQLQALEMASSEHMQYFKNAQLSVLKGVLGKIDATRTGLLGLLGLAVAFSFGIAMLITRSIRQPLDNAIVVMEQVANGDLTGRVAVDSAHELGRLQQAAGQLIERMNQTLGNIRVEASHLSSSASALSDTASEVHQFSQQQSDAAASMAAALEQMSVSISHVTSLGQDAQALSRSAGDQAQAGAQLIQRVLAESERAASAAREASVAASALGNETQKIHAITEAIKAVAEQTNLLALNAAIEAARAGEQGRGFAVVADEVRTLSEKTANSAQEISSMLASIQAGASTMSGLTERSVSSVSQVVEMAGQAGAAVNTIRDGTQQVVDMISVIYQALNEQSSASQEIGARVENIVQMIASNTAAMDSVAGTASDLRQVAGTVNQNLERFRLGH